MYLRGAWERRKVGAVRAVNNAAVGHVRVVAAKELARARLAALEAVGALVARILPGVRLARGRIGRQRAVLVGGRVGATRAKVALGAATALSAGWVHLAGLAAYRVLAVHAIETAVLHVRVDARLGPL